MTRRAVQQSITAGTAQGRTATVRSTQPAGRLSPEGHARLTAIYEATQWPPSSVMGIVEREARRAA